MEEALVNCFYGCNGDIPWPLPRHIALHAAPLCSVP